MKYIGIDLAWGYKNPTGICILNQNRECIYLEAKTIDNGGIADLILQNPDSIISIDAPLVIQNETGSRGCDRELMRTPIHGRYLKLYATSRSYMNRTFGGIRGEEIIKLVSRSKSNAVMDRVYETYPTGVFLSLFPQLFDHRYKLSARLPLPILIKHAEELMDAIIALGFTGLKIDFSLAKTKKDYKEMEDKLDAVLCAVASYYIGVNQSMIIQVDSNGRIALPRI